LVPRARQIRLMKRHTDAGESFAVFSQCTLACRFGHGLENVATKKFGGRQLALELRKVVKISVGERLQNLAEHLVSSTDIDDHVVTGQLVPKKGDIHDVRRAVHVLRRPEE